MAYEERRLARQKVRYSNANDDIDLIYQLVEAGAKVTPTSATIAVSDPSGDSVLTAQAMTVSGSLLTYTLSTTTTASYPVGQGYRADLVITANSKTYERHFLFDVATYVFVPNVSFDQLVALDDSIRGMAHDGDEDFSPLIEACRDELQLRIENRMRDLGERVLEEHILDASRMAIPFRRMCLYQIHKNKGSEEKADEHKGIFDELYASTMAVVELDTAQDGTEGSVGAVSEVTFVR